ncbi:hypothetical protein V8F20_003027 [Naviculisporaceae sp. PSN 640]
MVSFQCEGCGDVLTKKKLDPHRSRCQGATFSCIDCMVHFPGTEYRSHTSCMTEEQKYQGALYRGNKKAKTGPSANTPAPAPPPAPVPVPAPPPAMPAMARPASVEDVQDEYDQQWREYEVDSDDDDKSVANLPEAPTPPSAAEANVNVFDYFVGTATPTASNLSLPQTAAAAAQLSEETQLVRFDYEANGMLDKIDEDALVQYGTGPVPTDYQTPAPKAVRKKSKDSDLKKSDKKRKRLHVDTDHVMSDAPPVLHSGLTGGLNRLMSRPSVFPPSPDYSGGDVAETPASPLKKTKSKHHKHRPEHTFSNSIMSMISAGSKPAKTKKRAKSSSTSTKKKSSTKRLEAPKEQKMIEYRPGSKDGKEGGENQMIVFKPRAEQFFSYINKGPESERGCSINKVLKRYHRERSASTNTSKLVEEKELWRTLRVRKNERGEIVLFSI